MKLYGGYVENAATGIHRDESRCLVVGPGIFTKPSRSTALARHCLIRFDQETTRSGDENEARCVFMCANDLSLPRSPAAKILHYPVHKLHLDARVIMRKRSSCRYTPLAHLP